MGRLKNWYNKKHAPLAQLDRVPVFGTGGMGSNPMRGRVFTGRAAYLPGLYSYDGAPALAGAFFGLEAVFILQKESIFGIKLL